jgi:hypothetical protein
LTLPTTQTRATININASAAAAQSAAFSSDTLG